MASRVSDFGPAAGDATPGPEPEGIAVHLVPMRRRHLRSVMRIEAQVYPRPWSLPLFMSELNLRSSRIYYVARVNGLVVGYCGLMLVEGDGHITNIAVDPAWHRHQIGTRLLLNAARQAAARDATRLTLEVRMSNRAAQELYRKFGFEAAGVRKNYYAESREDALIMWAYGLDTDAYAQRVAGIEASLRGSTLVEDGEPGR
ncbi:MAG: [ribosomal protein S18]-alanine N-acetyltransferase [Acidimicrobiaceae bacterium]|nr:[ribosomal protein S18]-alanine N-acetyltransferase [Acidimicrobiaceae bacterium]MDQ1400409.1 [ribosomal protein S18]-alanine N-acetyltransferase [Acidimicrobiaceae bacterium]MDQ1415542.1 [ribosomal protein S18]-alanine N-acetyltransferase [Acidimicrobiaceae bacterium]